MNARDVKTIDDAKKIVEERGLKHVKVGVFDIDGILRGKYMRQFFSALDKGFGFECGIGMGLQRPALRQRQSDGWPRVTPTAWLKSIHHMPRF